MLKTFVYLKLYIDEQAECSGVEETKQAREKWEEVVKSDRVKLSMDSRTHKTDLSGELGRLWGRQVGQALPSREDKFWPL